jgi:hydrogenase-4 membrane subunit HyfE
VSSLLIALLGALLVPLFVGTWRTSLAGLGAQGLLMALIAWRLEANPSTFEDWLVLVDLVVVRGFVAPLALFTVLHRRKAPSRSDVIPPNLLSWTFALGLVLASFSFSETLVVDPGDPQTLVAVATAGVLLGFLVLATQSEPFGQMVGALRVENAIALLELGGEPGESSIPLRLGVIGVFCATVALYRWVLTAGVSGRAGSDPSPAGREPTL